MARRVEELSMPRGLDKATIVGYDQGIRDFLEKPILLSTLTWNTQAVGDVLVSKNLPQDALSNELYSHKIRGYLGFRGTAVLRLQVNGNKFQQGRLLLLFAPQANAGSMYPDQRIRSLTAMTQLPRVELDLGTETEVVMEVPYISPTPFYNLKTSEGPFGRCYVAVYGILRSGTGSDHVDLSLWVSFKDVELVTPAYMSQGKDPMPTKRPKAVPKREHISEKELSAYSRGGPISKGLGAIADASAALSSIPLLSEIAGPAAWVGNIMSGVAAAFGYSKPSVEEPVRVVECSNNFHMANMNGADGLPPLSMDAGNKLTILPGFAGTDIDEMSLSHLTQIPAFNNQFDWTTDTAAGMPLTSINVHPNTMYNVVVDGAYTAYDFVPVAYFSNLFEFWRGSLVFTFKIIKTQFHSGRLVVCFNPAVTTATVDQSSYLLREIVDLRETHEFKFVVPYVSTRQYNQTQTPSTASASEGSGTLQVLVLNELVCPDTVADTVTIVWEVSAGPDFELACPKRHQMVPFLKSTWTSQNKDVLPSSVGASNEPERSDRTTGVAGIGSTNVEPHVIDPAQYCIGEKITSVLQLLKRFQVAQRKNPGTAVGYSVVWRIFTTGYVKGSGLVSYPTTPTGDYWSVIAPCFAYARGGMRYMWTTYNNGGVATTPTYAFPTSSTSVISDNSSWMYPGVSFNINGQNGERMVPGAQIPGYTQCPFRLVRPSIDGAAEPLDVYTSRMVVGNLTQTITMDNVSSNVGGFTMRACADDTSLGYFVGVPLVTLIENA